MKTREPEVQKKFAVSEKSTPVLPLPAGGAVFYALNRRVFDETCPANSPPRPAEVRTCKWTDRHAASAAMNAYA